MWWKFIIIAVAAWLIGVLGWAQIIGSIQNISRRKELWLPLLLWSIIMAAAAYFAITKFDGLIPLLIGYVISFISIITQGRIE